MSKASRFGRYIIDDLHAAIDRERRFHSTSPFSATLFLTYRCNSRCVTCTLWTRPHREEIAIEIGIQEWKIVVDRLHDAGITAVEVFGGNVLLRKPLLIEVLHYLKKKGFTIYLPTNQIGLDDAVTEAIISTVDCVLISTDGVGESQDAIRGLRGSAELAENAIARFRRLRTSGEPPPRLVCFTTVSRLNADGLGEIADYAYNAGFDEIHFDYACEHTPEHIAHSVIDGLHPTPFYLQQSGESILLNAKEARNIKSTLSAIRQRFQSTSFSVRTINIDVLSEAQLVTGQYPVSKCRIERIDVTVDPYGNLVACPFINNYVLGNIVDNDFNTVWNNARHRRFREVQNAGELEMCRHCMLAAERNRGVGTSLKRMYIERIRDLRYRLPSSWRRQDHTDQTDDGSTTERTM